jgi:DNA-binding FadR family transcriptional regulator
MTTIRITKPADPFAAEIAARLATKRQQEAMREILAAQAEVNVLRPARPVERVLHYAGQLKRLAEGMVR